MEQEKKFPNLRVDYSRFGKENCTSIALNGKELTGIRSLHLDVPRCDEGAPTLTLEIDVAAFNRNEIPFYMK